jgi:hypothetical protein
MNRVCYFFLSPQVFALQDAVHMDCGQPEGIGDILLEAISSWSQGKGNRLATAQSSPP